MTPGDQIDELYALPLDEFTPARNELAKKLRGSGDREAANDVKALKKPTAAAWAVNQVVRGRPKETRELLKAGERLREAHERLASGKGDAGKLREAAGQERAAVASLMEAARGLLGGRGEFLSEPVLNRVEATFQAAATDDEARVGLESGRLERERRAVGGLEAFATSGAPAPRPAKKGAKEKKPKKEAAPKADPAAERREREAREREEERKKRVTQLRRATRDGDAELERLTKKLAKAESRRADAEEALRDARETEKDARARARELERELAKAHRELERLDG